LSRRLANFIREEGKLDVLLLDSNARLVAEAAGAGLPALCEDALNVELAEERIEFQKTGHLLALTDNSELNELLCRRWTDHMGSGDVFQWSAARLQQAAPPSGHRQVAFPRMAKPSVIASELADGEARTETVTVEGEPAFDGMPLLAARGGEIVPYTGDEEFAAKLKPGDRVLVLRRAAGFLARSFEGVFDLRAASLEELYRELIGIVVERHPAVSQERALAEIASQGVIPAMLGHGVAIPHLYSPALDRRVSILARLPECGVVPTVADEPGNPGEEEPLRLVFFVVSPAGDPEGHLATLAEVARFCGDPANRDRLIRAANPDAATRLLLGRIEA